MGKKEKTTKKEEVAIVPVPQKTLVLEGDPDQQLEFASKASRALMKRVESKPKKVVIGGKQYLEYGDWQTLARFFGATAGIEWSRPIQDEKGKTIGFEARAIVYQHGQTISSAEAECLRSERNWANREAFALRSMAQTRAAAKALRNAFGWVAEIAGYASTPAEEMDYDRSPVKVDAKVVSVGADDVPEDVLEQKKLIIRLVCDIDPLVDPKLKKDIERVVGDNTGLALTEKNYPEIIRALQSLLK